MARKYTSADPTANAAVGNVMKTRKGHSTGRRPTATITIVNRQCAYVTGYNVREELTTLRRGRPPLWSPLRRAWVTTEATSRDLVAALERRNYDVYVTAEQPAHTDADDPGDGSW